MAVPSGSECRPPRESSVPVGGLAAFTEATVSFTTSAEQILGGRHSLPLGAAMTKTFGIGHEPDSNGRAPGFTGVLKQALDPAKEKAALNPFSAASNS